MTAKLPEILARYFTSANAHDVEKMMVFFAREALVRDEGREHHGLDAIRGWIRETIEKYDYTVEPTAYTEHDGRQTVTALVSGTFPGSPASIHYEFTLARGKILLLEIR
jgi:hypothetical protein